MRPIERAIVFCNEAGVPHEATFYGVAQLDDLASRALGKPSQVGRGAGFYQLHQIEDLIAEALTQDG